MVDLRSPAEREEKPDPRIDGVENLFLPVIQDVRAGITHGQAENARIGQVLMSGAGVGASAVDAYLSQAVQLDDAKRRTLRDLLLDAS